MIEIRKTEVFDDWFNSLSDRLAQRRIQVRIDRLQLGNPGDVKPVGPGVSEMRIDYGPGCRVYFAQRGTSMIVLLAGGAKRTQQRDIDRAIELSKHV
jgi:putative addiction module killer protein